MTSIPDSETLPPGTVLDGKYRLMNPIGQGGMGVVYRAEHLLMRKEVAVKRLHAHFTAIDQISKRFEREAQAAARIDHPNICLVTDCGRDEQGGFYIVMELLLGRPLDEELSLAGSLRFDRIVHIASQVLSALDRAHFQGIVHRDLKPENIMLVAWGDDPDHVKIMDFGIAKMATERGSSASLTQAGMVFGTPSYLSPEQAAGDHVDRRSDLYSLGVLIFELATGRCPFESSTAANLIRAHLSTEPPTLADVAPDKRFPPGFQRFISRLLAKNPDDRYPNAKVCRDHLIALAEIPERDHISGAPLTGLPEPVIPPGSGQIGGHEVDAPRDAPDAYPSHESISASQPTAPGIESTADRGLEMLWKVGGWRRRSIVVGAIVIAALIVGAVLAATLGRGGSIRVTAGVSEEESLALLEQERALFGENGKVKEALTRGVEGRGIEAIAILEDLAADPLTGSSPPLYWHLAVLNANEERIAESVEAASQCLAAEPRYSSDPVLLGILVRALREKATGKLAAEVMIQHPSKSMALRIEKTAREDPDSRSRTLAIRVLREGDMMRHLEKWSRIAVLLADPDPAVTCEQRRELVVELTQEGNSRALSTLALYKERKGCGDGTADCWSCMRTEWKRAVAQLQGSGGEK